MRQPYRKYPYPGLFFLSGGVVMGALAFFTLPIGFGVQIGLFGLALLLGLFLRRSSLAWLAMGCLAVCLSAQWQTRALATTEFEQAGVYAGIAQLTYQEPSNAGYRLVFHVSLPAGEVPVRLTHDRPLRIGGVYQIAFWATPVSGPLYPGGFDPRFKFAFDGVQGFGRLNQAHFISAPRSVPVQTWQTNQRLWVNDRVRKHLPGQNGAVVSAMLTGVKGGLTAQTLELFRASGLSHLLAISGLHLSLLAGFAFAVSRALFWVVPIWNLHMDQRKIATLVAMAAAIGYFFLSGAAVPTQRALILVLMAGLAFLAGRRALTWRLWALALALILIAGPHYVFAVSAHLSFLAVAILIRASDLISRRPQDVGGIGRVRQWSLGLLVTTFAVNILTTPILLLVFGQAPTLGVLANLFAVPLAGVAIIPLSFLALAAMPFGAEGPILQVLGAAINLLFTFAETIADLSFVELVLPRSPLPLIWALLLAFACLLYPGWSSWRGPMAAAFAILGVTILPLWLPKPSALHHPSGWVLKHQGEGVFLDMGLGKIPDYDFSQVGRLWQANLDQAVVQRAEAREPSQATHLSGPVLMYEWQGREIKIPDRWLRNTVKKGVADQ